MTAELPYLGVAQGEAKVRQIFRGVSPFTEVWRGRWQAGYAASAILRYIDMQPPGWEPPDTARHALPHGSGGLS